MQTIVDDGRCHSVCLDLEPDLGADMGPSALELCVMSYAGCLATIFCLNGQKNESFLEGFGSESGSNQV